ncbi:hypothetical protein SS50377_21989 [Spironucleus salmonicida]|uniref:Uncharacterized protein n=1 Tax=Spironucleus salmonicida TaxID=348837 RepID=V6LRZ1_9EUKA|nr:hypothetical protein SS50377_21989 [Spironucleus salmonicida]|eukprot:EST47028.1 Hypothetical protein SS50377_12984 [Spironucleus salmonicida]
MDSSPDQELKSNIRLGGDRVQSAKRSRASEPMQEDDLPQVIQKIRLVNEEANGCVSQMRDFNTKISETISGLAKKQILVSGEQSIEPRICEMYKQLMKVQLQIQQPEQNQLSLVKMDERLSKIEQMDVKTTMKIRDEIQRIKEMLMNVLKIKGQK